jgi:choline-sulfatase
MSPTPRTKGNNFLIIMADQLTPGVLGTYGHPLVKTPHIDALAASGTTFDQAYCNSPLCAPARFALMAGQLITRIGAWDNAAEFRSDIPTFAHYLRTMDYYTCLSGKMHFVGPDQLHGFEDRVTTDVYPADYAWAPDWERPFERIEDWYHNMLNVKRAGVAAVTHQFDYDEEVGHTTERRIYELARSPQDTPFCLMTSFIHPHDPYTTRQRYWDRYNHDDIDLPQIPAMDYGDLDAHSQRIFDGIARDEFDITNDDIRNARHAYYGNVSYIDDWVGRIVAALEEAGLRDSTTIILTADHGDMLGERGLWYKMSFFEPSVRVPLIISGPDVPSAKRISAPVSHVDILPTLTEMAHDSGAGAIPEPADSLDGESLVPFFSGDGEVDDRVAISEHTAECAIAPVYMIRRGDYKFIHSDPDPAQLFHMVDDPLEQNNLTSDDASQSVLESFQAEIAERWDSPAITQAVIASQKRRRAVHAGMSKGRHTSWDWHPKRDYAEEYMRSHQDVSETDRKSQFPTPTNHEPIRPRSGSS